MTNYNQALAEAKKIALYWRDINITEEKICIMCMEYIHRRMMDKVEVILKEVLK